MAKFSQALLQGLLNPAYQGELMQAAKGLGQTPGLMREQQQAQQEKQRQAQMAGLEASGVAATEKAEAQREELILRKAIEVATSTNDTAALQALQVKALDPREYLSSLATRGAEKPVILSAGAGMYDPNTGKLLAERGYKPEAGPKKGIKTVERDDGSIVVLDDTSGDVISTIPPPGKGTGDRDAALNLIAQTTGFIQDVDELMDPGYTETGFIGGMTSMVPGTPAYDREKELLSIRARLGFDQINTMKELAKESGASGTGLGQISNIEFMSLQSTIDAIYVGMSGEAQNKALQAIKKHLLNVQKLASGIAPADAIEWDKPEYKAVGYHKDPVTGVVFFAPDGPDGTRYKLVDGKFVKIGTYLGTLTVE